MTCYYPGVIGLGTHDHPGDIYIVRLEEVDAEPRLVDARAFSSLGPFTTYWAALRDEPTLVVGEQYSPDPHGALDHVESRGPLERRFIEPCALEYQADLARLGLDWNYRRGGVLALTVLYDLQTYRATQAILEGVLHLSNELRKLEQRAARLLLGAAGRVDHDKLMCPF